MSMSVNPKCAAQSPKWLCLPPKQRSAGRKLADLCGSELSAAQIGNLLTFVALCLGHPLPLCLLPSPISLLPTAAGTPSPSPPSHPPLSLALSPVLSLHLYLCLPPSLSLSPSLPSSLPLGGVSARLGLGIFLESVAALDCVARYPGPLPCGN